MSTNNLSLTQHLYAEVLTAKMYLILSFRQKETKPYMYTIMRGSDIGHNYQEDSSNKFYLLNP